MMGSKLRLRDKMTGTWLIQRLHKPEGFDNPFSFGGGLLNGGFSDEAMNLLRGIWSFDYMGSAEFEFGAVPQALRFIVEQKCLAGEISVGGKPVYYVCPPSYEVEVKDRIQRLYKNEREFRLKEHCGLRNYIDGEKYGQRNLGWLEIDNGFAFFVDKEMWEKFCKLLGIEKAEEVHQ